MAQTILIIGASSGIGLVTARTFAARGWSVFGTTRDLAKAPAHEGVELLEMDVRSDESVRAAMAVAEQKAGQLDALFCNAGLAMLGSIEETSLPEYRDLFETNVFGLLRCIQAALPGMRRHQSGTIVLMSSMSGYLGVPFHGAYAATKHAVEAIGASLRFEAEPFGIRVAVVEPEAHRTGIHMIHPKQPMAEYGKARSAVGHQIEGEIEAGPPAQNVADVVYEAVTSPAVPFSFRVGQKAAALHQAKCQAPEAVLFAQMKKGLGLA